jgi:3-methylfumaryl-CoA hydratase
LAHLEQWVGRETISTTLMSVETANLMAATLSRPPAFQAGESLPLAWYWLYFHETVPTEDLGQDGHTKLGGFLPPVPLPRRMWAGGHLTFERPIPLGQPASKRSKVAAITPKQGRSGQLCFVEIENDISVAGERCLLEKQMLVYREAPQAGQPPAQPQPAPNAAQVSARYEPNPPLLFRYSALTFNSHRIHYDVNFCRGVEGYPDLVVHGPLIATLLLDLCSQHYSDKLLTFDYQARSPLFHPHPFTVNGSREGNVAQLWAANKDGDLAMQATATFATG